MDPNPIKHLGSLMKRVRREIEPALITAGFRCIGQKTPRGPGVLVATIDYVGPTGQTFLVRYEQNDARLVAELLDRNEDGQIVAITEMKAPRSTPDLLARIEQFKLAVIDVLSNLKDPLDNGPGSTR